MKPKKSSIEGFDESKSRKAVKSLNIVIVGSERTGNHDMIKVLTSGRAQFGADHMRFDTKRHAVDYLPTSTGLLEVIYSNTTGTEMARVGGHVYNPKLNPYARVDDPAVAVDGVMVLFDRTNSSTLRKLSSKCSYLETTLKQDLAATILKTPKETKVGAKEVPVVLLGNKNDGRVRVKGSQITLPRYLGIPYWSCCCKTLAAHHGGCVGVPETVADFFDPLHYILRHSTGRDDLQIIHASSKYERLKQLVEQMEPFVDQMPDTVDCLCDIAESALRVSRHR